MSINKTILIKYLYVMLLLSSLHLHSQTYDWEWVQSIASFQADQVNDVSIAIDNNNYIYIYGSIQDTAWVNGVFIEHVGGVDAILVKFDQQGNLLWSETIGSIKDVNPESIVIDNKNNIYVNGKFTGLISFDGIHTEDAGG
ncbi:MAG: hypothetical protein Kow0068_13260 [Marinilabiliales bacterium]